MNVSPRIFLTLLTIGLAGCQSGPQMSVEDAKQLAANFKQVAYVPPKRNINDIVKKHGTGTIGRCYTATSIAENKKVFESEYAAAPAWDPYSSARDKKRVANAKAFTAFFSGNHKSATYFNGRAIQAVSGRSGGGSLSNRYFEQTAFSAYTGDVDATEDYYSTGVSQLSRMRRGWEKLSWQYYSDFYVARARGLIARMKGELDDAERYFIEAQHYRDVGMKEYKREGLKGRNVSEHASLRGLGAMAKAELAETLMLKGELKEAESMIRDALDDNVFWWDSTELMISSILTRLTDVIYAQGRYEESAQLAEIVVKRYSADCAGRGLMAQAAREVWAKSLLALDRADEAQKLFDDIGDAMKDDPEILANRFGASLSWAASDLLNGKVSEAETRLKDALEISQARFGAESIQAGEVQGLLGVVKIKQGSNQAGLNLLDEAFKIITSSGSVSSDRWVRQLTIKTYMEQLIKSGDQKNVDTSFRVAQGLAGGSVQKALNLNAARAGANDPELAALIRQQQDLQRQIETLSNTLSALSTAGGDKDTKTATSIRQQLSKLRPARNALAEDIAARFPRYDALINPKPLGVSDVQKNIKAGQSVMVIRTFKDKTFIWAVPKSGTVSFAVVNLSQADLIKIVDHLREALDPGAIASLGDIPAFDVTAAFDLYNQLLKPVEAGWKDSRVINLVAQGPISQLPLSLLVTAPANTNQTDMLFTEYKGTQWLARSHAISMLPSVTSLVSFSGTAKVGPRQSFVGFGDPYFSHSQAMDATKKQAVQLAEASTVRGAPVRLRSRPQTRSVDSAELGMLPRLPATGPELTSIATNMGADPKTSVYLGKRANEKQVKDMKLDNVDVLAFATHGLVPGDLNGLDQPALAMSAPKVAGVGGDGLLTMGEILSLKLNADWVVLSACNTASAEGAGAEAISGLGKAFFYAGARSLLVSNWPVHSGATAKLTTTLFFLQAKDKSIARAEALQKTRLEMIDNGTQKDASGKPLFSYAHPIFWAPFTVVGDGGGA
jgi:CHAT domain-containing protein